MDIICVTETCLSAGDTETLSLLPGYTTIRGDRDSRGGGIMAIINDTLLPTHLHHLILRTLNLLGYR